MVIQLFLPLVAMFEYKYNEPLSLPPDTLRRMNANLKLGSVFCDENTDQRKSLLGLKNSKFIRYKIMPIYPDRFYYSSNYIIYITFRNSYGRKWIGYIKLSERRKPLKKCITLSIP